MFPGTLDFNFSPKPASITEISKSTGLEVSVPGYNATTGVLSITLIQGEGRLFALPAGFEPYNNLAAAATVTATSSYESTRDGWGKAKLNDDIRNPAGVNSGGWTSNGSAVNHTESVTLDLGSAKTVGEVDLFPRSDPGNIGAGFPVNFTIQIAANSAGPWTTVVTKTAYPLPGNTGQSFVFTPASVRYVKIEGTSLRQIASESGTPYRMQLAEVEIYASPNYAKGSNVTATSSLENSDWGLAKVNDQIQNSVAGSAGYSSNNSVSVNHTESITFDMLAAKTINRIDLYPRNYYGVIGAGFPINFTVQVATNAGGPWTTVVTQTGYAKPGHTVQSFSFASQSARYVKVEGTSLRLNGTEYRMQFSEIEIH